MVTLEEILRKFQVDINHNNREDRVRNLKFARNLIFATSKTLVNFIMKMMFCLKFGIFQFKKPKFTVHLTNLTSISLFY